MNESLKPWAAFCRALAEENARTDTRRKCRPAEGGNVAFEHRWEHVQQVVAAARWLARETGADAEIVEAAAWLHDIHKGEPNHAEAAADDAPGLLAQTDFPAHKIAAVAGAIRWHEGLTRPYGEPPLRPLERAVLWDADKLTKVGVQALAFNLSACWFDGLSLAERRRSVDSFTRETLAETVESFNTEPARELARWRYAAMLAALDAWAEEEVIQG
jgi:uncharacterized protein